jgi:hypothetical protein
MLSAQRKTVTTMSDFDAFDDHFMPESDAPRFPSDVKLALIEGKQTLLRDESDTWYRSYLPKFAAMAAQLRRDAEQREEDSRSRLELALHFDELAMQSPCEEPERNDNDGPY